MSKEEADVEEETDVREVLGTRQFRARLTGALLLGVVCVAAGVVGVAVVRSAATSGKAPDVVTGLHIAGRWIWDGVGTRAAAGAVPAYVLSVLAIAAGLFAVTVFARPPAKASIPDLAHYDRVTTAVWVLQSGAGSVCWSMVLVAGLDAHKAWVASAAAAAGAICCSVIASLTRVDPEIIRLRIEVLERSRDAVKKALGRREFEQGSAPAAKWAIWRSWKSFLLFFAVTAIPVGVAARHQIWGRGLTAWVVVLAAGCGFWAAVVVSRAQGVVRLARLGRLRARRRLVVPASEAVSAAVAMWVFLLLGELTLAGEAGTRSDAAAVVILIFAGVQILMMVAYLWLGSANDLEAALLDTRLSRIDAELEAQYELQSTLRPDTTTTDAEPEQHSWLARSLDFYRSLQRRPS